MTRRSLTPGEFSGERRSLVIGGAGALGLGALGLSAAGILSPISQALAAAYAPTPQQTEGPFYPLARSLGIDPDLIHVPGEEGTAVGEATAVTGRVIDVSGKPLAGVLVEVWQANGYGRYNDARDRSSKPIDRRFKGYGTCETDDEGRYRFLTIKPVPYPGRAPHIHFALSGQPVPRKFVTQMYVAGAPENDRDSLLRSLSPAQRRRLLVEFDRSGGQWKGSFDIVI
jgi:protocatechuate 3,4-dioxygenase beta subunit